VLFFASCLRAWKNHQRLPLVISPSMDYQSSEPFLPTRVFDKTHFRTLAKHETHKKLSCLLVLHYQIFAIFVFCKSYNSWKTHKKAKLLWNSQKVLKFCGTHEKRQNFSKTHKKLKFGETHKKD
jgi:hypothetical protein